MEAKEKLTEKIALEEVVEEVARWRQTRVKRGAMPEGLWEKTVKAAEQFGIAKTALALGLNSSAVKRRFHGTTKQKPNDFIELERLRTSLTQKVSRHG